MQGGVVVLDFGSQYTQLIARRVREAGVYCEILPCHAPEADARRLAPGAIILSGGPSSIYEEGAPDLPAWVVESGIPVLGICYGMQILAARLGGDVRPGAHREYGRTEVIVDPASPLFAGLATGVPEVVWMSHGDTVAAVPPGFLPAARSESGLVAAMGDVDRRIHALQFHPEVVHTPNGARILANFLFGVAGLKRNWSMEDFVELACERVRAEVGSGRVLVGLSGGVDSSVVAAILCRAIPGQVTAIFVDNGLLREGERQDVEATFAHTPGMDFRCVDASRRFLDALRGVTDPEQKRRVIGTTFIRVFEDAVRGAGEVEFLAQGTLYPDVIESVSVRGPSHTIKSHHNVGGLPPDMKFRLVEPLRELFKDEVRRLGSLLGLPDRIVWRQPFPGPGLAVRCLGEIDDHRLAMLRRADAILNEELAAEPGFRDIWQSFAVLLPVRSVGVMGDQRTYDEVVALRVVTSQDGMTADCHDVPMAVLKRVAARIVNHVKGVNRVVFDLTSKPPATIEWE